MTAFSLEALPDKNYRALNALNNEMVLGRLGSWKISDWLPEKMLVMS